ncbi:UbiA prenyltransferase family-domain-containing protein [Rhodocollybia butyracea]|uniref:Protoheme IX farnesyltransferase, mitochondrial n=1 Tax=Rhodocollybia butyracea TaxID=206335 RepID=A0A9P5PPQ1_9AGAR|nr:UbiA prenyltransferase family-domain-containing protein [Rhodocollybia butyracea]
MWSSVVKSRTSSAFTSFFFNNAQWASPSIQITRNPHSFGLVAHPRLTTDIPRSAFKQAEVLTPVHLTRIYWQLSKSSLTVLNVLTAMSGVALSPLPTTVPVLLATAVGTALCSASANTLNQLQEVPFDAQMARTRMRPIVRRAVSPLHAAAFAGVSGIVGPVLLWTMTNPTTAIIGAGTIALYAGPYTWMKRKSIINTWLGAVVGAAPPLMGWSACGGQLIPSASYPIHIFPPSFLSSLPESVLDPSLINSPLAPFALFVLLFSWQFPHFNSLSYVVRGSYTQAGCHMLSVLNPRKNALVSLRHALILIPTCSILIPLSGLTTWWFALSSLLPNAIILRAAYRFWQSGGEKQARALFRHSLWYLPLVLGMMMAHKQGI